MKPTNVLFVNLLSYLASAPQRCLITCKEWVVVREMRPAYRTYKTQIMSRGETQLWGMTKISLCETRFPLLRLMAFWTDLYNLNLFCKGVCKSKCFCDPHSWWFYKSKKYLQQWKCHICLWTMFNGFCFPFFLNQRICSFLAWLWRLWIQHDIVKC